MSESTVKLEIQNKIAEITIARPKALNALNTQVLDDLSSILNDLETNKDLRCLIITGEGEKAFVAGADIKEIKSLDSDSARKFSKKGHQVFRRLEVLPIPSIAAVNGFALGGGLELALACDFIIASQTAQLGLPEVTLGLIPGFGGTQRLTRTISPAWARRLILSAEKLSADQAKAIGLVTEVVPQDQLLETSRKLAGKIARQAPVAVQKAREVMERGWDVPLDESLIMEQDSFGDLFRTEDVQEGLSAFIEKRKADFQGK